MTRFLLCFFAIFLMESNVFAEDRQNITVSPADTLSADVINDINDRLRAPQRRLELPDLVGEWAVRQSVCLGGAEGVVVGGLCVDDSVALEGAVQPSGTYFERTANWNIAFADESQASVLISSNQFNFFFNPGFGYIVPNETVTWECSLSGGSVLICLGPADSLTYTLNCPPGVCRLHVLMAAFIESDSRIRFSLGPLDTNLAGGGQNTFGMFNVIELSRAGLLPTPQFLVAERSVEQVNLTWSVDEEEYDGAFEIQRKENLLDPYTVLGTTSETSFSDQPAEPGDYWYRVFSIRDEERSTGSNVRKITYD